MTDSPRGNKSGQTLESAMSEHTATPAHQAKVADLMSERDQDLVDRVLIQIQEDIENGDVTAIEEMLYHVPIRHLEAFLSEDQLIKLRG